MPPNIPLASTVLSSRTGGTATSSIGRGTRRSLRAAALALLCALGSCAPESVEITESVALFDLIDVLPGAGDRLLETEGDHTDQLALLQFDEELSFPELDFGPGVEVAFKLRIIAEQPSFLPKIGATITAVDRAGVSKTWEESIPLQAEPGQYWIAFTWKDEQGQGLSSWTMAFHPPLTMEAEARTRLKVGVLRPTASFAREVELAKTDARQILLVTLDTLRADHLGCYGHESNPSPRIDGLAAESILFESCYSTANVTNPSHASILTSLHLNDHEVKDNFTKFSDEIPNLVTALRARAFKTAAFVSSKNFAPGLTGFDTLFEEFFPCDVRQRRAEEVNLELLPWLTDNRGSDFFVWVHYFDAHAPYDAPYPFNVQFEYRGPGLNPALGSEPIPWVSITTDRSLASSQYLGEVAYLDDQLGRMLDHLKQLDMYEDATIVVVADHGESLGEHGIFCSHSGLHETTTRVPLVFRSPEVDPGVVSGLVSTLDIYPTLFDLLDLPIESQIRGRSLRPQMESLSSSERELVFAESAHGYQVMVRTPEHRAILGLADAKGNEINVVKDKFELFATTRDAKEKNNVAKLRPQLASKLRAALLEHTESGMELGSEAVVDPDFVEEMEGLGYVK